MTRSRCGKSFNQDISKLVRGVMRQENDVNKTKNRIYNGNRNISHSPKQDGRRGNTTPSL
jgi:hypothetical protein